jgi:predicted DNA-binding transcriptional regulator YafY
MPASKKALHRYQLLNKLMQNSFGYTIKQLAERVNEEMEQLSDGTKNYTVSERMIRLDLENMMDVYPVEIKNKGGRFFYENKEDSINNINLREEEKIAINLALGVFSRYNGTPIFEKFSDAITRILASSVLRKINTTDTHKYIHLAEVPENSGIEWLERIYNSIIEKKAIKLHYKNFGESTSVRVVSPYMLKEYRNNWYMIAYAHETKRPGKTLLHRLSRIIDIEESNEAFIQDNDFDGNKYFKYTLGVFHKHSEDPIDVKLKIKGKGIIKLLSEDRIHPTQEMIPTAEEECVLQMRVFNTPELKTLIMGYGKRIEVIEPASLRTEIINDLNDCIKQYN